MLEKDMKKRLGCFVFGLLFSGFGVAISTRAGLGTTPISSLPYALTFVVPLSFGTWTFFINLLFLFGQIIIYKRQFKITYLSQLGAVFFLGIFIDLGMYVSQFYVPASYLAQITEFVFGCLLIALGIACEVIANVTFIPGEGFVMAVCRTYKFEFGFTKICLDVSLVLSALVVCVFLIGHIEGLREGTVIAAFAVGWITRLLLKRMSSPLKRWCYAK